MDDAGITEPGSVVYFITAHKSRKVKIGYARNLKSRMATLQTGNHSPLKVLHTLPGGAGLEAQLHGRFSDDRIQGEWFRLSDRIREFIFQTGGPWLAPAGSFKVREPGEDFGLRAIMAVGSYIEAFDNPTLQETPNHV